ncbi:hypothetical protein G6O67_008388 [Ophiocordyceps sinensis]|uniref:Uncharacterized protein n=2 Tax=Ophiocordyceps sinensis TaxID=72228 RepID=A0A8H4PJI1_9HYPO|nr:hypothetical protein OCS_04940 [Ophiocordyceps sinensis CO18]KAF4504206.1 hypothetical protein G6O67_008388 [Ophiocordyceps sinensis]
MCSIDIIYAYCPGHYARCEVRRENEELCPQARLKFRMGSCKQGVVVTHKSAVDAHCRNCLIKIERGIKDKKKKQAAESK